MTASDDGSTGSDDASTPAEPAEAAEGPEDLKAKYREALAHKQASHAAEAHGHGDKGSAPHGTNANPGQRMFRRKSGG